MALLPMGTRDAVYGAEVPRVTALNWYWGPANRWSWLNTRRLFPSADIDCGDSAPTTLQMALRDISTVSFIDSVSNRRMTTGEMLQSTYTDGFIVLKDGAVLAEQYFNGTRASDRHLLMSITKSVTGTLAGILIERGVVDAHALVTDYLPELKGTIYDGATVRNLLDMTVAMRGGSFEPAEVRRVDQAAGWVPRDSNSPPGLRAYLATLTNKAGTHGERFLYLTHSTIVLSWILERATHTDFAQLLQQEIWAKLGAEHSAYVLLDAYQEAYTAPGLNTTLRDLARFGQMMLQNGRYNGQRIVPREWIDDIRMGGDPNAWRAAQTESSFGNGLRGHKNGSYRSNWWIAEKSCGRYAAFGLGGQVLVIDPVANVVVAKFSSPPNLAIAETITLTQLDGIDAVIRTLSGHGC
jgi:CubicO group peptidase (beta-lactamase class C family)